MGVGSLERDTLVGCAAADDRQRVALTAKRVLDVVVAGLVLLILAPALLLVAVAILVLDGRPIFFRQERVGQFGRLFTIYKFRTMVPDAHERVAELADVNERRGPLFKVASDPRVTRVGGFLRRTSLDELPQLFNVLMGTMSLVGPRPALPEERAQFPIELLEREQLPQGLSGLWQLEGRHNADFGVYRDLDLQYVRTWTLGRDLAILVRTPFVVGAHALCRTGDGDPIPDDPVDEPAARPTSSAVERTRGELAPRAPLALGSGSPARVGALTPAPLGALHLAAVSADD